MIGDMLFSLMGRSDPRMQLASALGQGPANSPMASAIASGSSGSPGSGAAPSAGSPGQPQQPQAYTTPPDLANAYLQLMNRQQANQQINSGLGLLAAGLSHNQQNRGLIVDSMSNLNQQQGAGGVGAHLGEIVQLQQAQMQRQMMLAQAQHLPEIAKQLNIPIEQAQALWLGGGLNDVMKSLAEKNYEIGTPQYQATLNKTLADADLSKANIGKALAETTGTQATTAKTLAETAGTIPDDQMKELNSLNASRKAQGFPPLDILSYKMFSQPLDPAMRAYYMTHPEMMPSGMTGVSPGSAPPGGTIGAGSGPAANPPAANASVPPGSAWVPFEDARKANFNNVPPVMPKPMLAQPIPGESFQSWQARQGQASAANDAATKAAVTDQQESISTLKDGAIDDIGVKVQHLQSLLDSPLLPYAVGKYSGRLPNWVLPQNVEDFRAQLRQAQEAVYQTATTKLKGVTNRATQQEIGRVAEALGKLDATNQSPDAYKQAINENINDLASAALRTTQNAGVAPPSWLQNFKPTQPGAVTAVKPGLSASRRMTDAERAQAQDLIKQYGRDAVIQHLQQKGVDTSGL